MTASDPVRLIIVDDHPIVREGLRAAFGNEPDFTVVGEAGDGAEALTLVDRVAPDVVLMDLRMPGVDGVTAIRRLRESGRGVPVLVLTTYDSDGDVVPAIEAGAAGYLLKDAPTAELLDAVRAVHRGTSVLSPALVARLMEHTRRPAPGSLTRRELQVLQLVADGAGNREAAAALFISEASIKTHLTHIYNKLDVRDRAAAVGEAYRRGLLPTPGDRTS
ncbi:DNA-binding response regulator [Actinomadura spongiicola]|uniref:DNA-binding response regulator n=1 Tax=Actinomadura spongiicola TaxID=2303421 RepID=A0A372GDU0_9ACTN|nr:response regulator transcription factor [Actinomadura spongiicola]RFS83536.1 DNA-binding response regulator [Actinomadura spongiicola]